MTYSYYIGNGIIAYVDEEKSIKRIVDKKDNSVKTIPLCPYCHINLEVLYALDNIAEFYTCRYCNRAFSIENPRKQVAEVF